MHHIFRLETEIQTGYQERVHSIGFYYTVFIVSRILLLLILAL